MARGQRWYVLRASRGVRQGRRGTLLAADVRARMRLRFRTSRGADLASADSRTFTQGNAGLSVRNGDAGEAGVDPLLPRERMSLAISDEQYLRWRGLRIPEAGQSVPTSAAKWDRAMASHVPPAILGDGGRRPSVAKFALSCNERACGWVRRPAARNCVQCPQKNILTLASHRFNFPFRRFSDHGGESESIGVSRRRGDS